MLMATLAANVLGNILASKQVIQVCEAIVTSLERDTVTAGQDF